MESTANNVQFNGLPASIYKALLSDPDTLNFDEAMNDTEFKDQWKKAMESKIIGRTWNLG
jgi:hypothetical protein